MSEQFFSRPILNSPYGYPGRHWQLDEHGQPTQVILDERRRSELITPIPQPKHRKGTQRSLALDEGYGISTEAQQYATTETINRLRKLVDEWRGSAEGRWGVTPETARLMRHWRSFQFSGVRPF